MELIHDMIQNMPSQITCEGFCRVVTEGLQEFYDYKGADIRRLEEHPSERITASCIVYSIFHQEIWMIGDCQCLVDGVFYDNPKPSEQANALKRSVFIKKALANGKTVEDFQIKDEGRALILPDIIAGCLLQNRKYSVFDGFPVLMENVRIIPCKENKEIVLASDGYPFLKPTLQESEKTLQELLEVDPLCVDKFLATKGVMKGNNSFDDRAYIRFQPRIEKKRRWWFLNKLL
jgi:glycerophosphoryl diester phosphodiesterase